MVGLFILTGEMVLLQKLLPMVQSFYEWVIIKKGMQVTIPFDDDDEEKVYWEMEAAPRETKTETLTAPSEAGTYTIVCGTPAHLEQGMTGTLIVK